MHKPLVYVSNSYQAPSGLKGHVIEQLATYDCDVISWGEKGSESANLKQIREKVDIMLIIPPADTYYEFYCTVGNGQRSELESFYRGNSGKGGFEPDKHIFVINYDHTIRGDGTFVTDIFVDECEDGWEERSGDNRNNVAKLLHTGEGFCIGDLLTREMHSGLHYDHDRSYEAGKQVAIAHLALYGQLN